MFENRKDLYAAATVAAVAAVIVAMATRPDAGLDPMYTVASYFAMFIFTGMVAMVLFFAVAAVLGRGNDG